MTENNNSISPLVQTVITSMDTHPEDWFIHPNHGNYFRDEYEHIPTGIMVEYRLSTERGERVVLYYEAKSGFSNEADKPTLTKKGIKLTDDENEALSNAVKRLDDVIEAAKQAANRATMSKMLAQNAPTSPINSLINSLRKSRLSRIALRLVGSILIMCVVMSGHLTSNQTNNSVNTPEAQSKELKALSKACAAYEEVMFFI